jgi:hypothetical protein
MRRRRAILHPTNVHHRLIEVDLLSTKIDKLGRAQPMPESDQDHRRVAVALSIVLGRLDEALDLCRGQVLSGPQHSVRGTPGAMALRDCALLKLRAREFLRRNGQYVQWPVARGRTNCGLRRSSRDPPSLKDAESGEGAMLLACRLAGLSALETHYAGVITLMQTRVRQRVRGS